MCMATTTQSTSHKVMGSPFGYYAQLRPGDSVKFSSYAGEPVRTVLRRTWDTQVPDALVITCTDGHSVLVFGHLPLRIPRNAAA
jgi:hypothetical protein